MRCPNASRRRQPNAEVLRVVHACATLIYRQLAKQPPGLASRQLPRLHRDSEQAFETYWREAEMRRQVEVSFQANEEVELPSCVVLRG